MIYIIICDKVAVVYVRATYFVWYKCSIFFFRMNTILIQTKTILLDLYYQIFGVARHKVIYFSYCCAVFQIYLFKGEQFMTMLLLCECSKISFSFIILDFFIENMSTTIVKITMFIKSHIIYICIIQYF